MSWEDPESWIQERLEGQAQLLAKQIWGKSQKRINPRYLRGPKIVADRYALIEAATEQTWALTPVGREFLESDFGAAERGIDLQEGMAAVLRAVLPRPNARRGDLLPEWHEFVVEHSNIQQESVVKNFLYYRLQNLMDRKLVEREGQRYRLTERGEDYLKVLSSSFPDTTQRRTQEMLSVVEAFNRQQRELLRERLENMNPFAFEHLIRDLLTEMDYDDVQVTQPTNDKGVDVKAKAQFGITTVNEVIQAKRQKANIQRPILDMLRGSLHRFEAQKGTIITTGDFGKGAREAAFEKGAAPIELINGERLLDLLIEHGIGVKRKPLHYYEVDEKVFQSSVEEEMEESMEVVEGGGAGE